METRQLKYFLDVANCLNFTKAAQMNHMAQTTMSQNINSLEAQLGFKLFERSNRNVKLSPLGEVFYNEAIRIITASDQAERYMTKVKEGIEGMIRIGFQGQHESRFLPKLIKDFHKEFPKISVELLEGNPRDLEYMLDTDGADVVFNLQDENRSDNTSEYLVDEQDIYLVVPFDHRLAKYDILTRDLIASEKMVFFAPSCCSGAYNNMIHASIENGFQPDIIGYAKSINSLLTMVECGIGITILPNSVSNCNNEVKFIELSGEDKLRIVARWKNDNSNPGLQNFLKLMKKEFPHK